MSAETEYDDADDRFLAALKLGADRNELARLARDVREAAKAWQANAYRKFFELRERDGATDRGVIEAEIHAEKAEALSGLWSDLAEGLGQTSA